MATVRAADVVVSRLEEQVRELRTALEGAAEAICRIDLDGRIQSMNRAFCQLFGLSPDQASGRRWEELLVAQEPDGVEKLATADKLESERLALRRDGNTFPIQLALVPVQEPGGRCKGHYLFIHDLSERRRMENQLIFAGRMAAVGTLAAGVAHEINNPLAYIVANIDFARNQINTVTSRMSRSAVAGGPAHVLDETAEALTEARQGAERVRNIVRDLRVFARGDDDQSGPVAVRRVLDSSINIAWNEIRHRARLVKDFGEVPLIDGNESRLGQVFLNLLLNAAQAIPEGEAERNEIRVSTATDRAGRVIIEVRDTGAGIAPEILSRIFEPFFTTKPDGVGTGLGLWICRGILADLGGTIAVESRLGHGSAFRVTLPPAAVDPESERIDGRGPEGERQGERVLIIDDEPLILGALRRAFAGDYRITCISDARQALSRLASGERYDVVLCDLMMPEMSGMDVYAELARVAPDQVERMIFLTGGAFTTRAREFLEQVPNARIEKPIDFQNLRALMKNLLR